MNGVMQDPAPPAEELFPFNGSNTPEQFTNMVGETRFIMAHAKNGRARVVPAVQLLRHAGALPHTLSPHPGS
eukprot:8774127-Lingulodinium_polyedra.AAC.1